MNAHKQTSTPQARGEQVAGRISMSRDAVEMTDHAHPPNSGAGQKTSGQGHNPQSRKLCMRQAVGVDNGEMHADDEAESHRLREERLAFYCSMVRFFVACLVCGGAFPLNEPSWSASA